MQAIGAQKAALPVQARSQPLKARRHSLERIVATANKDDRSVGKGVETCLINNSAGAFFGALAAATLVGNCFESSFSSKCDPFIRRMNFVRFSIINYMIFK